MQRKFKERRLLSVKETAAYLNISPRSIYNRVGRKARKPFPIAPIRIGSSIRFDIKDLDEYVESQKRVQN